MDTSHICEYLCEGQNCIDCYLGNPCLSCDDYDKINKGCTSNGSCFDGQVQSVGQEGESMEINNEVSLDELADKIVSFANKASDEMLLIMMYTIVNEFMARHALRLEEKEGR